MGVPALVSRRQAALDPSVDMLATNVALWI